METLDSSYELNPQDGATGGAAASPVSGDTATSAPSPSSGGRAGVGLATKMTVMTRSTSTDALLAARDALIAQRLDYAAALETFRWPDVGETFNFAHDWFDPMARGNDAPALVISEPDGSRASYSFDELARRSDAVARYLDRLGVGRGDSVIVMLGNQVELWETMLAAMKVGAVLMPTTTAVGTTELVDRLARGRARAVVSTSPAAPRAVRSWSSTPTTPIPSDTSRRCTGSVCAPATCT
jgi:non-ribosomal peptide synthetase component F